MQCPKSAMDEWMPNPVALDLCRNCTTLRWGKCRASLNEVIPCLCYSTPHQLSDPLSRCFFSWLLDQSGIPEHHVEIPTDACIQVFLLRLKHLEEALAAVSCLHFLISYLKQATVVIILKYHGAFHEQACLCHLFSYLHDLPVKLQLYGISQKLLGILTHLLLHLSRLRKRHISLLWSVLGNITSSAVFCSQVIWVYFPSLWMLIILFHICFPTLQYYSVSAAPPISLEAAAARARRRVCPFTSSL